MILVEDELPKIVAASCSEDVKILLKLLPISKFSAEFGIITVFKLNVKSNPKSL